MVVGRVALVLADIQNEFLEEKESGTYYALIEDALKKRDVVGNLEKLLKTAQELGYFIVHSPHWYYPTDQQWTVPPGAKLMLWEVLTCCGLCIDSSAGSSGAAAIAASKTQDESCL